MIRRIILGVTLALLGGMFVPVFAQGDGYVDDFIVHVKGDKRGQYDALVQKLVAANRANNGDNWIALETTYGEGNTIRFVSLRQNYAAIEEGQGKFMGALVKALTGPGAMKLFGELGSASESTQGVLRARRMDLSTGVPANAAAEATVIGNARWVRSIVVHVKPGMGLRFEAMLKNIKAAAGRTNTTLVSWISVSVAGDLGSVYYITQLRRTLSEFDSQTPMRQMMGEEAYMAYMKEVPDVIARTDTFIYSVNPGLSNPPKDVAAAAPDFWNPKPMMAPKPKPATGSAPPKKN